MSLPEFEISEGPPVPPRHVAFRRPWVWFGVALVLVFMIAAQLYEIAEMPGVTKDRARLEKVLQSLETELNNENPFDESAGMDREFLERAVREISAVPLATKGAKGTRERTLLILRQELGPKAKADFSKLSAAADDIEEKDRKKDAVDNRAALNKILKEIYTAKSIKKARADELRDEVATRSGGAFPYELVMQKLDKFSPPAQPDEFVMMMLGLTMLALLVGGVVVWIMFAVYRVGGGKAEGIPIKGSVGDGDDLGLRMLMFLLCFIGLPVLALPFRSLLMESRWAEFGFQVVLVAVVAYFVTRNYGGIRRTLAHLGFRSTNLGKDVLFGIGAWLANWPIMVVLFFVGRAFFSWIPSGEHPLAREFMEPSARIPLFLSAAVIAPLLEETTFRGLLFQGLFLRTRSLFWAVFLSSFAFAAIHPQGGALWPTLGWIGAMGALVTHERGSLVPAVVMHAMHNGTLLLLSIVADSARL